MAHLLISAVSGCSCGQTTSFLSFAAHPVAIAIKVGSIARIADPNRRGSGRPGRGAVGEGHADFAGGLIIKCLWAGRSVRPRRRGRRRWRSMAVIVARLPVHVTALGIEPSAVGERRGSQDSGARENNQVFRFHVILPTSGRLPDYLSATDESRGRRTRRRWSPVCAAWRCRIRGWGRLASTGARREF